MAQTFSPGQKHTFANLKSFMARGEENSSYAEKKPQITEALRPENGEFPQYFARIRKREPSPDPLSEQQLELYSSNQASRKPFICYEKDCKETFENHFALKKHAATHSTKRYICPFCGKTFTRRDNEMRHQKKNHPRNTEKNSENN